MPVLAGLPLAERREETRWIMADGRRFHESGVFGTWKTLNFGGFADCRRQKCHAYEVHRDAPGATSDELEIIIAVPRE